MQLAARYAAAIEILDDILAGAPAEKALTRWARGHRFAGSKDRAAIRDHVFDALRTRRSSAALGGSETGRGIVIGLCRRQGVDLSSVFSGEGHAPSPLTEQEQSLEFETVDAHLRALPPAERLDCQDWVFERFSIQLGDGSEKILAGLQNRAPVFLRVNTLKGTPDDARDMLAQDGIIVTQVTDFKNALDVTENARKIRLSNAYLSGLVELQDISSQSSVSDLNIPSNARVLDYCAGGGGKSLALAAHSARPPAIYAHDIEAARMRDLPDRAARAGANILPVGSDELAALAPFDVVFVDAPCTGSGTWRRTPDSKWRLTEDDFENYCRTQAELVEKTAHLVVHGGMLVYATCSLFREENEDQIDGFLRSHADWVQISSIRADGETGGDGFYHAVIQRI